MGGGVTLINMDQYLQNLFSLKIIHIFLICASFRSRDKSIIFKPIWRTKKENKKYSENLIINGDSALKVWHSDSFFLVGYDFYTPS